MRGRPYYFAYWLAAFMFLNGVYALFDQIGLLSSALPPQASYYLVQITDWPIVALSWFGAVLLAAGRYFKWSYVAVFGVAINPAFRLYFYLVGPIIDPSVSVNYYFSFLWLFLLIFFTAVVYREVGFHDADDSRPRKTHS